MYDVPVVIHYEVPNKNWIEIISLLQHDRIWSYSTFMNNIKFNNTHTSTGVLSTIDDYAPQAERRKECRDSIVQIKNLNLVNCQAVFYLTSSYKFSRDFIMIQHYTMINNNSNNRWGGHHHSKFFLHVCSPIFSFRSISFQSFYFFILLNICQLNCN